MKLEAPMILKLLTWFTIYLLKFIENGNVTNTFESWQPNIILAQILSRDFDFIFIICLIDINLLKKWRYVELLNAMQLKLNLYLKFSSHLEWRLGLSDIILKGDYPSHIWLNLVKHFQRKRFICESLWRTTDAKNDGRQVMAKTHLGQVS